MSEATRAAARVVEAFEAGRFSSPCFRHRQHVRLAWAYLRLHPPAEALLRLSRGLRDFAARHGQPHRYHETVTWAYSALIAEALELGGRALSWEKFAAAHPGLLRWPDGAVGAYYSPELLATERAHRTFVLPDRVPPPDRPATLS